ncbi:histidine phosphatase family protein [Brevibacillus daliensis]|uniref:histidine phosphatase family protein n=1 Tax=Brevibacillus daliensis TaxID=2892995 RepID=UPI001E566357|nr:histidine phosphatase family protein [Brevibacillus daliensis]
MVKVIWMRHAVTLENQAKQYIGHLDAPLAQAGVAQAEQVAKFFANRPLTAIYSSDLHRAKETAFLVAKYHSHIDVLTDSNLREVSFGDWEGLTYQEIEKRNRELIYQFYNNPWEVAPPNGENLIQLESRLKKFVTELISKHCKKDTHSEATDEESIVLVVTHGGMLRLVSSILLYQDRNRYFDSSIGHGQFMITRCTDDEVWQICNL